MSVEAGLALAAIGFLLIAGMRLAGGKYICSTCGSTTRRKLTTKGSILIEIILWCCFIIPGLIYSLWRHASRFYSCPRCGGTVLIPLNSPRGRELTGTGTNQIRRP